MPGQTLLHRAGGAEDAQEAEQHPGSPAMGFGEAAGVMERKSMTVPGLIWQQLGSWVFDPFCIY